MGYYSIALACFSIGILRCSGCHYEAKMYLKECKQPVCNVGHCYDSMTGNPPRGLQFVLGTNSTPAVVDTIVMANLVGYLAVFFFLATGLIS
jgi:hypothetical protein